MRMHRAALMALLIAAAPAISGCADFDLDKLDVLGLNQKKKLPGERHAVFPEGVPGVSQGIPQELMRGQAQSQPGAAVPLDNAALQPEEGAETKTAAAPAAEEKPKAKPKKKVVARPARIDMKPQAQQPEAASAQAAPAQAAPAQPAGGWAPPANNTASPWPAPVQTGTFSKQQ